MKIEILRKIFTGVGICSASIIAILGIDMLGSRSVFAPLAQAYSITSWAECHGLQLPVCTSTSLSAVAISGKQGAVVTASQEASAVGLEILKEGGNAVDAAVAVGYALAVTEPCCGNIGGGGFMLIHRATGKDIFLDFREKAPLKAKVSMFLDRQGRVQHNLNTKGYLAVGVPGTVKGLDQALAEYGTMTRTQVMSPAIKLARDGFVLRPGDVRILHTGTKAFAQQPNVAAIFLKNGTAPYQVGDRLVQKSLANTLSLIAQQGPSAFYQGSIAKQMLKNSAKNGGILSQSDFSSYTVAENSPIHCDYRGDKVVTAPPPGGGTTLCEMLNILNGYQLKQLGFHSVDSIHLMLEAMLYAYADRNTYLGDPAFVKNPVQRLLSQEYAAQIRQKITKNGVTSPRQLYSGIMTQEGTQTTHYSVVDRYGNAVAVTYTINGFFGAKVIAGDTGFFLNNEMDDFTSKPGVPNSFGLVQGNANAIAPGKRPLSSMTPTIVMKNGKVLLVTGSPGGPTITTTVLQILTNMIDYNLNVQAAVNAPRIHYQGLPNFVITEPYALQPNVVQKLWEMGYRVFPFGSWGAAESIWVDPETGTLYGANDVRRPAGAVVAY